MSQFFDLFAYTHEIRSPDVAAQVAQSVAWKVDTMIQAACRQALKNLREINTGIDGVSELRALFEEQAFAEQNLAAIGGSTNGPVNTIRSLMNVREACHTRAAELTALTVDWIGRPRSYTAPDTDDLFFGKVELKMKASTKAKAKYMVDMLAEVGEVDAASKETTLQMVLAREQAKLDDKADALTEQGPLLAEIFRLACTGMDAPGVVTAQFYELDIELQRELIKHAMQSAAKAVEFAMSNDNLDMMEFISVQTAASKVKKDLTLALNGTRFTRTVAAAAEGTI